MINATQVRKGNIIKLNDKLYRVEYVKHITPGKGNAIVQTKIRDLNDLTIRDNRFRSVEKVEKISLESKEISFSYQDGEQYIFMDNETYDEISLNKDFLGDMVYYLNEEVEYVFDTFEGKPMGITPPMSMVFEVIETEQSIKGATVQASYKPAKLSNDLEVMVPAFIEVGSIIKIDTRDGSYQERVKK